MGLRLFIEQLLVIAGYVLNQGEVCQYGPCKRSSLPLYTFPLNSCKEIMTMC